MPVVSPPSSTSSASHTHLLSHYYGINGDSPDDHDSPTTILSRQFDGTQSLFEVAARLADGKELLNDALTTITDKNATTKMTNIAIKVIRKSIAASNGHCINTVTKDCQFGWSHCWRKLCSRPLGLSFVFPANWSGPPQIVLYRGPRMQPKKNLLLGTDTYHTILHSTSTCFTPSISFWKNSPRIST